MPRHDDRQPRRPEQRGGEGRRMAGLATARCAPPWERFGTLRHLTELGMDHRRVMDRLRPRRGEVDDG